MHSAELHDRRPPSNGRELAQIAIAKRGQRFSRQPRRDEPADIVSHLLGGRRDPWNRLAILAMDRGRVTDHEYLGMIGTDRSGRTSTRPARSCAAPSQEAAGEATTPAAQMIVLASM